MESVQIDPVTLTGTWHQDSTIYDFYHSQGQFSHHSKYPFQSWGTVTLTVFRWHYAGNTEVEPDHAYILRGNTLLVQQEGIGHENGRVDTMKITGLNEHGLILQDRAVWPDGSLRIGLNYYSR